MGYRVKFDQLLVKWCRYRSQILKLCIISSQYFDIWAVRQDCKIFLVANSSFFYLNGSSWKLFDSPLIYFHSIDLSRSNLTGITPRQKWDKNRKVIIIWDYIYFSHVWAISLPVTVTIMNSHGHDTSSVNGSSVSLAQQPATICHHFYMISQTQTLWKASVHLYTCAFGP